MTNLTTAIWPIGSFSSVMILVKLWPLLIITSCKDNLPLKNGDQEEKVSSIDTGSIIIEVEPSDGAAQFFYNVNIKDLNKPLIAKRKVKIEGSFLGDKKFIDDNFKTINKKPKNLFIDLWAQAQESHESFMLKNNIIKTRLDSEGRFSIYLLENTPYLITLNPFGLKDMPPMFLNIDKPDGAQKYNISVGNNITINGYIENNFMYNKKFQTEQFYAALFLGGRQISSLASINKGGNFVLKVFYDIRKEEIKLPLMLKIWTNNSNFILSKITQKIDPKVLNEINPQIIIKDRDLIKSKPQSINITTTEDSNLGSALLYLKGQRGSAQILIKKNINNFGIITIDDILYGHYDMALVPSKNSVYALMVLDNIKIDNDTDLISMTLERRKKAKIKVEDFSHKPLAKAKVELIRIGQINRFATEDIFLDRLFSTSLYTDDNGVAVSNNLDHGRYEVLVTPPIGSALSLIRTLWDFPSEKDLKIILPKPTNILGQITLQDKTPLKFAFITIYKKNYGPFLEPKILGQGITDEQGYFNLLVSL